MTSAHTESSVTAPKLGLRERKKIQTRQAIRQAAYRLFDMQGYDATPVDQIAEVAEVSPSTVFRYFPTKEDIVLTDEYDPLIAETLRNRPADEPPVTALRETLTAVLAQMYEEDTAETLTRVKLIYETPTIRARMTEHSTVTCKLLVTVLSERTGRPVDDLELRIVASAALAALSEAFYHWVETGLHGELSDLVEHALGVLERGLTL